MDSALYDQLMTLEPAGVYDIKLPEGFEAVDPAPVIVVGAVSDIPDTDITGKIVNRWKRVQFSVYGPDQAKAQAMKEALIAALQGWSGGSIKKCLLENGGPELYDNTAIPATYHLPVDFMVSV